MADRSRALFADRLREVLRRFDGMLLTQRLLKDVHLAVAEEVELMITKREIPKFVRVDICEGMLPQLALIVNDLRTQSWLNGKDGPE